MNTPGHNAVVIVAGGKGLRMGADVPKQFLPLAKKPMLMRTIEKFYEFDQRIQIVVVLHPDYVEYWKELTEKYKFVIPFQIIEGGETRFQSVKNGLSLVQDYKTVAIHDAARPFVSTKLIGQCYHHAEIEKCGVIPVVDEKNSLRHVQGSTHKPLDRSGVKIVQTPQVFPAEMIKKAYEAECNPDFTDDATVAENAGMHVLLIQGEDSNIKVTTTVDLDFASFLLKNEK